MLKWFAVIAAIAEVVISGAQTMGVEDAVRIGLSRNPQVLGGNAGVEAALATYRSTAILPPVTLSATHVQGTSTAPTLNGTNNDTFIDFGETLDLSGQRRFQAAGANATYEATRYQFQETLLTLEQQIRDAYWSLAAAQAQTTVADAGLKEAQRVYDLSVKQEQAGASPRGDVIRSSIDVANAKQTLIAAQSAEKSARIVFNNLLALPPSTPEKLADDLAQDKNPAPIQVPTVADLTNLALQNRPLLKSAVASTKAARFGVRQAEATRFPDLSVDYQRSTKQNIDTLIFGLSFPILDFGSTNQSIKAARESRKQVEAQQAQTRQQIEQEVAQAHSDLEAAIESAAGYKKDILDPSVTLLSMAQLGYQQGATGILPVIDAESTIRNARVGYINSLLAVHKAQDALSAAVGKPQSQVKP